MPLRDDRRQGPQDGDRDHARTPVAERDPVSRGISDREVDLHVAANAISSNAPQWGY
jgi:hypothetical protein